MSIELMFTVVTMWFCDRAYWPHTDTPTRASASSARRRRLFVQTIDRITVNATMCETATSDCRVNVHRTTTATSATALHRDGCNSSRHHSASSKTVKETERESLRIVMSQLVTARLRPK